MPVTTVVADFYQHNIEHGFHKVCTFNQDETTCKIVRYMDTCIKAKHSKDMLLPMHTSSPYNLLSSRIDVVDLQPHTGRGRFDG